MIVNCYQSDNELIFPIDIDSDLMVSNQIMTVKTYPILKS